MALFSFECEEHGSFTKLLVKGEKEFPCPKCGKISARIVKAGGVRVTERLDNGMWGRAVERLVNIDELTDERNARHEQSKKDDEII